MTHKTIGGLISLLIVMGLLYSQKSWFHTRVEDIIVQFLYVIFVIGAITFGVLIADWLEKESR